MAKKRQTIPYYFLSKETENGVEIKRIKDFDQTSFSRDLDQAHRDSHYIFMLQEGGHSKLMVDFEPVEIRGKGLFFIRSGQVHHSVVVKGVSAWIVAIEGVRVDPRFRHVLDDCILDSIPALVRSDEDETLFDSAHLLEEIIQSRPLSHSPVSVLQSAVDTFIGLFINTYLSNYSDKKIFSENRYYVLTRQFKSLVRQKFKTVKTPGQYAALLNVSTPYLNEAVRRATGLPLSHWIQQEIIVEAKRLLFHTDRTIKEIAHDIGYEDHTYFSRIFQKYAGETATTFRSRHSE
jgi:AraC family transcriptional activator of pobA